MPYHKNGLTRASVAENSNLGGPRFAVSAMGAASQTDRFLTDWPVNSSALRLLATPTAARLASMALPVGVAADKKEEGLGYLGHHLVRLSVFYLECREQRSAKSFLKQKSVLYLFVSGELSLATGAFGGREDGGAERAREAPAHNQERQLGSKGNFFDLDSL
jgi:hypothetical protein